jgi:ankyrin repeat protein
LVCWSWIARECGVQIDLIDVLLDAGASVDGRDVYGGRYGTHSDSAIYNKNTAAAERLIERGAQVTLTTALCLGRWADVDRLLPGATPAEKEDAFVQAALNGRAEALRRMLAVGIDPTTVSERNQSHGTALHHAAWSGSLEAVKVLVEAGADFARSDTIYHGTPLGWALHAESQQKDGAGAERYAAIARYLREQGARE